MVSGDNENERYEARLRRRLEILTKELEAGKIFINPDLKVIESLKAVRYAPDGSIDLTTVDSLVRSFALGIEVLHDRKEIKDQISLNEIQSTYFEFIERTFGVFFEAMLDRGLTPHQAGIALSQSNTSRIELESKIPEFIHAIKTFWDAAADATQIHTEDLRESLKAVFGGDLFPSYNESIASKCGIYADTIILPDPFLRSEWAFSRWNDEKKVYYFVKHALNLLQYKSLVDANLDVPIIVILPTADTPEEKSYFADLSEPDALAHAERLFGQSFASFDEFTEFATKLTTPDAVLERIADGKRLLFDTDWKADPKEQLVNALSGQYFQLLGSKNAGLMVVSQAIGRMSASNELLARAARLNGVPVIDAPTSWQYFAWKLEYDANRAERAINLPNLHIMKGLQAVAQNEMRWLGKIPHEALIEIRKDGALGELRHLLGAGVSEIATAKPLNFYRTADKIFDNIQAAFSEHEEKIKELQNRKWRFAGRDIGTWLAVGTLEVAAAATGHPIFGLSAFAANQVVDAPKLKDLPKSIRGLIRDSKELNRSPVGLLFSYSKKEQSS